MTRNQGIYDTPYSEFVAGLFKKMGSEVQDRLHAGVGISGEAGELLDAIKKEWAYGKTLDRDNVKEELGDLMFYITAMCNLMGWSLAEVIEANRAKLSKRYPGAVYTNEAAIARLDKVGEEARA